MLDFLYYVHGTSDAIYTVHTSYLQCCIQAPSRIIDTLRSLVLF